MNEQARQEALHHARETSRRCGLPDGLGEKIMSAVLGARGHLPSDDPFNAPLFPPDYNPFLDPGWDDEPGAYQEARGHNSDFPFAAPGVTSATTVTAILVDSDTGEFKIVKLGHTLVQEDLFHLGHPELAYTIRDFHTASRSLDAMRKEKGDLKNQLEELRQFVAEEPTLIAHTIRQQFPDGTAGKIVSIAPSIQVGGFQLIVGELPTSVAVPEKFGQAITARQEALDQASSDIEVIANRREELCRKIADAERALPVLEQKTQRLFGQLDRPTLEQSLNGEFVGLDFNEQGQVIVLVRQEVNETLTELPTKSKRALIAQILSGRKLPENVQAALGIKDAIDAVTCCLNPPPEPEPEIAAPEAKATAKSRAKAKRRA